MKEAAHHELSLRDLTQAFYRRRIVFISAIAVFLLGGAVACLISTRQYQASATVELRSPMGDGLDRETLLGDTPMASDPLTSDITMQTQAKILQSDTLALRTISSLSPADQNNILNTSRFLPLTHLWRRSASKNDKQLTVERLNAFRRHLSVQPVGGTRLLQITCVNRDPNTAANIVNGLVKQLVAFGEETRSQATDEASRALAKELDGLRRRSEEMQQRVASMQSQTGMYDEGTTDPQGRTQAYSAILEQFRRASATLSDATQDKILKEAIYHVAQTGNAELISSLAGNTLSGAAASSVTNSLGTVQNLRVTEDQMQQQLDQLRVKFGPEYPKVAELQAGIAGIEHSIKDETERITARAKNDSAVADRIWEDAQQNYDVLKAKADQLNNKAIGYRMMQQEADDSRTLYTDLSRKLNEAGILQGLSSNTIGIVDSAHAPTSPSLPSVPLYMAIALALGLFSGVVAVAIAELLDDTVTEFSTIEEIGVKVCGILPVQPPATDAISSARYGDAIRQLRSNLVQACGHGESTVIVIAPVTPGRNVRHLAAGLSGNAASAGYKVLLVEANYSGSSAPDREPTAPATNKLELQATAKTHSNLPSCYLLSASRTDNPSTTLEPAKIRELIKEWRSKFDMVFIYAPAVLFQPDAALLGKEADVNVQVVTHGVTTRASLKRSRDLLRDYRTKQVTAVIEGVPVKSVAYRNYYGSTGSTIYTEELIA